MSAYYSQLIKFESHADVENYDLIPFPVWVFDLEAHGFWWGNKRALEFWGLEEVDQLIAKDLSGDTEGARHRMWQTFEQAVEQGVTKDPWTTYPDGKPKTLYMMHRAVLLGPEDHRGIIAFINEEVNLGEEPENLLLVEAMRYTRLPVTSFTKDGDVVAENPAATELYRKLKNNPEADGLSAFVARFEDPKEGEMRLEQALTNVEGQWDHLMKTANGPRKHTLDIRMKRHPLTGDYLILVSEYDVTELHDAKEELRQLANYDALTGLPSLRLFQENMMMCLAAAKRKNTKVAVHFVDLDGFKAVNDSYGHNAGDYVLKTVANRLSGLLRESDRIARIGGDEFILMQTNIGDKGDAANVAKKVIAEIQLPIDMEEGQANISASVGVAIFPDDGETVPSLLKMADKSMYAVKRSGKNSFQFTKKDAS